MMHARTFLVLLHGLIILFSHALREAADEKVDLKLRRYVISDVSAEGLTEKGAATLCRLHALTTNVPSATKRLLEETAYWLETAKNLQHNLTLEERRLKSARNRAGELPTEELKHAESKLENAKKLASAAVTLIREKESTVREAAEIAVANASSARGENTTVRSAGLYGALATHCANTSAGNINCVNTVMPKAGSDGSINCGSIPDVGGTSASAANMIAALSDWDVRKPYFDANYSRSSRVNCTKNSTVVCSVLEDWMPSFFASAVSLAKAEKAFLDFADVAAFAYDAFMQTRQAIDEAEKFAWAMDVKASISAANMTTQLRSCLLASREKMNISNFTLAANNTRFLTFLADALSHSHTVSTSALIVMHLMLLAARLL